MAGLPGICISSGFVDPDCGLTINALLKWLNGTAAPPDDLDEKDTEAKIGLYF